MVTEGVVVAVDGTAVDLQVGSLCVHGDTPGAVGLARAVRGALEAADHEHVVAERRAAAESAPPRDPRRERRSFGLSVAGAVLVAVGITMGVTAPAGSARKVVAWLDVYAGAILVLTSVLLRRRFTSPADRAAWISSTLWSGEFGRRFFAAVSRWRPSARAAAAAEGLVGPGTTPSLALMVDALPAADRRRLGAVRDLATRLERGVRDLERRRRDLDRLLTEAELDRVGTGAAMDQQRADLRRDVQAEQERLDGLRAAALDALETIRLQLIRVRGGIASAESVEGTLTAARTIAARVEAAIVAAGREEAAAAKAAARRTTQPAPRSAQRS
jgi:hypothetical protein